MCDAVEPTPWVGNKNPFTNLPRRLDEHWQEPKQCTILDVFKIKDGEETPPDWEQFQADANKYFSCFAAPILDTCKCFHCGSNRLATMVDQLLGTGGVKWGLVHGEAYCVVCNWPARMYHFAKKDDGEELFTLRNVPLSYLPEHVIKKAQDESSS
jgi:hypothetical protein